MNDKIKQMAKEILQPFFNEITETSCRISLSVYDNLPDSVSTEEKNIFIKSILEKLRDALIASVKSSIPEDFEKQLKEAFNGGK